MGNFIEIINRLKQELNLKEDKELAEIMGVTSSTFGNWKQRNSIPYEKIIPICETKKLDMRYILTGNKKEVFINFKEENLQIIEKATDSEQEKYYYLLKKESLNN